MADAYALIEINLDGDARTKEVNYFDIRLASADIEYGDIADQIHAQLPEGIKDVLILAVFTVVFDNSYHPEVGWECDDVIINMDYHNAVKNDYKEFYREMVTEQLFGCKSIEDIDALPDNDYHDKNHYKSLIWDWEELYDEDFTPFVKKTKHIGSLSDFMLQEA